MKVAIVGYGDQGRSAYKYWSALGDDVTVCDKNPDLKLPENAKSMLGDNYLDSLNDFDLIVRGPIIHPSYITNKYGVAILDKVTTVTNEFFRVCPTKNTIAVTGTKGKGTTATLIANILESAKLKVHLAGNNLGSPLDLLEFQIQPEDWVVLELANFQIIDLKSSPHIGVCLKTVKEHTDWHLSEDEYYGSKQQIFAHQKNSDIAIYYADDERSKSIAAAGQAKKIPYYALPGAIIKDNQFVIDSKVICKTNELKLLGKHNWQNVCAAITCVWQITQDVDAIRRAVISFTGLEHRLELVREIKGVKYFNDSFAAGPDAAVAAIHAIEGPKVVILGGYERNLPLEDLASEIQAMSSELVKTVLIGVSARRLAESLEKAGYSNYYISKAKTMTEVLVDANRFSKTGSSVVLSPGFASFDMFKNFEDRGLQFKAAVNAL